MKQEELIVYRQWSFYIQLTMSRPMRAVNDRSMKRIANILNSLNESQFQEELKAKNESNAYVIYNVLQFSARRVKRNR